LRRADTPGGFDSYLFRQLTRQPIRYPFQAAVPIYTPSADVSNTPYSFVRIARDPNVHL
jgi:hypothetical protein